MYRDNTLLPAEAIRLAALGTLALRHRSHDGLVREVRRFTGALAGPNLDVLGPGLELLQFEGLVEPVAGTPDLCITGAGRAALQALLTSHSRSPSDGVSRLIFVLKLRFLHLLDPAARQEQLDIMIESSQAEQRRIADLAARHGDETGLLGGWLEQELHRIGARIAWLTAQRTS